MRKVLEESLEIVDDPPAPVSFSRARRRWPLRVVLVTLLAIWAIAFPVRDAEARTQIRGLFELWSTAFALDIERGGLQAGLEAAAAGTDAGLVRAAYAALDRQEADLLSKFRARLPGSLSLDSRVRRVRRSLGIALNDERNDLRTAANAWLSAKVPLDRSAATVLAVATADQQLQREAAALGVKTVPAPTPPALDAADATVAMLSKLDDRPLPLRVLATQGTGLIIADLATGQSSGADASPAGLSLTPGSLLARDRFAIAQYRSGQRAAVIHYHNITAPVAVIDGPVLSIGTALRPDDFLATRPDRTVVELDGTGQRIDGPWTLPTDSVLGGQVSGGLVISNAHGVDHPKRRGIEVWDPVTNRTARTISADPDASVLAVGVDIVAWAVIDSQGSRPVVHFTSTVTGRTVTTVVAVANRPDQGTYALSPDGHLFAAVFSGTSAGGELAIVDTATGSFRQLAANFDGAAPRPNLVWDPSGQWLVALAGNGSGAAFEPTTHDSDPLRLGVAAGVALIAIPRA
jgi:hypothetical protein